MICRLCLNTLDEQNAVLLFAATDNSSSDNNKTTPENYLVQLISTHLYLCLSRDDAISTSICSDCCTKLESFHNFWKLVEDKQTTLCSQFLEIDCDVNWSEEGDVEQQPFVGHTNEEPDATPALDLEVLHYEIVKEETEFHESYLKVDAKAAATHKFPCMFCEKSFKMRRYLEEHVATHTGDRPIACAYCNMSFRCRSNMYTHVKTKHNTQWKKARAERESAKINSNNNIQSQRSVNGDGDKFMDAIPVPPTEPDASEQQQLTVAPASTPTASCELQLAIKSEPLPSVVAKSEPLPSVVAESEPMEAINLSVAKQCTSPAKRVTRSRRKTHSPKKVQHTVRSCSASEDSNDDDLLALHEKRIKLKLQTCKENELMFANYNAVAAVAAATQQQRLCVSIEQQQHESLPTAKVETSTGPSPSTSSTALVTACAELATQSSTPTPAAVTVSAAAVDTVSSPVDAYTCSFCGQQLRNRRALNNHLHNKHNLPATSESSPTGTICNNCGELPGQNHRCIGKAKYACDVCGKSFKMKRYLEEHFATHTGVKLHTCAFCPTQFRSKSNMYHHTKRKHKLEWELSRASRNAAKAANNVEQQQQQQQQQPKDEEAVINS